MKELGHRFLTHWAGQGFGRKGRPFLLALSGGLDSMVLAHLLLKAGQPFAAAHCHFGLRGAESDADALFVQSWCAANGIVCHVQAFQTAGIAAASGESIQLAARRLRYEWFETLRERHRYSGILTAHHADDVAETMLINLMRGTGIAGLHGIPERRGAVIRPLLFATRAELAAYAAAEAIAWREDSSNAKTDYLRNALRHEVLPKMDRLMPGAALRMAETAALIGEAERIYRSAIAKRLRRLLEQRGRDWYVPVKLLRRIPEQRTIAYELFSRFGFSPEQIPQILQLTDAESGRRMESDTHQVLRHRDFLVLTARSAAAADLILIPEVPARVDTAGGHFSFSWAEGPVAGIPDDPDTALLDAAEIRFPLVLRTRREGDYFYPLGMGGKKKKLKRFLIDIRMPVHEKERVLLLESDRRILWVAGKRIDERFRIRDSTRKILKVEFSPA